ncbi:DUF4097 family beta strand repeat-containing protein [Larkinella soli]|uniref:DUF4097 family beta strand repeat-containing protein n=1 Tax=Larkinella soli TaxID=1770527 RepID=UPI000FFBEEB5|nr:DUF4097 family beta strand repeat-containing protein [Larkinella soli]
MKTNALTISVCLLLGTLWAGPLLAQNENQNEVKEQLVVPLTDPGKAGTLEVHLINGSIHVIGTNAKEVTVEAVTDSGSGGRKDGRDDELAGGMKRINSRGGIELTAVERNNTVKVESSFMKRAVRLTIRVPQRFALKVGTVNQGNITVENITGAVEVSNVNGKITLTNIAGSAVANTVNGQLTATFREVSPNTPMAFSTLNGNVDVTFPANVKSSLKMKSDRGDIYSDFDIDVDKTEPKTSRSKEEGMYRVAVEDWVYGKINGGGPEVMMKNMHGNIYIRKAK